MPVFSLRMLQQPFPYLLVKLKKHLISWFPILTIKLFTTGNVTASKECQLEKVLLHSLIHFLEITAQYGVGNISLYSAQLVKINHWLYVSLVSACFSQLRTMVISCSEDPAAKSNSCWWCPRTWRSGCSWRAPLWTFPRRLAPLTGGERLSGSSENLHPMSFACESLLCSLGRRL